MVRSFLGSSLVKLISLNLELEKNMVSCMNPFEFKKGGLNCSACYLYNWYISNIADIVLRAQTIA